MAGTTCRSGRMTSGPLSSCGSPSAGSAPGGATAPGRQWWTMYSLSVGTGPCLLTRTTTRACANTITTKRQLGSRRKIAEKEAKNPTQFEQEATPARLRGRVSAPMPFGRRRGGEPVPAGPPPAPGKFQPQVRKTSRPLVCEKKSPMRILGGDGDADAAKSVGQHE